MFDLQRILLKVLTMAVDVFKSVVVIALSIYVLRTCQQSFKQQQAIRKEDPRNPYLSEQAFRELIDPVNVHKCTAQPDILRHHATRKTSGANLHSHNKNRNAIWIDGVTTISRELLRQNPASRKQIYGTLLSIHQYRICCVFPPFFTREVAKECGGVVMGEFYDEKNNVSAFQRISFDCTHWFCVLDKYSLLDEEAVFNLDKYYSHLDLWVSLNPMFADAMLEAKVFCKDEFRPEFPLHTCQFSNFQGCIRNYIQVECPIYIPSPECNEKKEFLKECKQFYHRRK